MSCDHLIKVRLKNKQFSLKIQITFSMWEESLTIAEMLWNLQYFFTMFAYVLLHGVWSLLKSLPLGNVAPLVLKCCTRISPATFPDLCHLSSILLCPQTILYVNWDYCPSYAAGRMCNQLCPPWFA